MIKKISFIVFITISLSISAWDQCSKHLVKSFFYTTKYAFNHEKFNYLNSYACQFPNEISDLTDWIIKLNNESNRDNWKKRKCNSVIDSKNLFSFFYNNATDEEHKLWRQCQSQNHIPTCELLNPYDGMYSLQVNVPSGYHLKNHYKVDYKNVFFYMGEPNVLSEGIQEFYFTKWEAFDKSWIEINSLCRVETRLPQKWNQFHQKYCGTVYEHIDYGGKALELYNSSEVNGVPYLSDFGMQDMISSSKVAPGCKLEIFTDNKYTGGSTTLYQDNSDWRHISIGQDTSNSLRCVCHK